MHLFKSLPLLIVAFGLTACSSAPPADEFSAAWKQGHENEHDGGAGSAYIHQMVKSLGPALTASTKQCGARPAETSKQPVQLVLQLNADGSVRKALIAPPSAYWDCVQTALKTQKFPPPPRDAFWTSGTIG
jgi:hypothetical protein